MLKLIIECFATLRQRPSLSCAFALASIMQVGYKLSVPYFLQQVFDDGIAKGELPILYRSIAGLAGTLLLFALAILLQERVASLLALDVTSRLRRKLFAKLLAMPADFLTRHRPSSVIDRMGGDVGAVEISIARALPSMLMQSTLLTTSVVLLFLIQWQLALVVLASLPLTRFVSQPFDKQAKSAGRRAREARGRLLGLTHEATMGHAILRLLGIHEATSQRFDLILRDMRQFGVRGHFFLAMAGRAAQVSSGVTQLIVIGFGGWLAYHGFMTAGLLVAFVTLLGNVSSAVSSLSDASSVLSRGVGGLAEIHAMLRQPGDVADRPGAVAFPPPQREIRFDHVSFGYGDALVLDDVNLIIRPGERVCMVGTSGSGKSTVLALLTRLFEPRSGTILFDGIPLSHATDASLRDIMTVVPQSSTLFQGTIRDNIVIGRPAATDGDVARAAAAAALEDLAAMLPGGLDAPVGEGGSLLSGGQRQRVAIARALLREAPILLLDEATSAVDAGSEETINRTLTDHSGRTVIAITHRLAAAAGFDRVLVFDKGRLVQDGPHARLAAEPGLYNALWAKIAGLSAPSADAVPAAWLRNIPFFAGCRPEILQALATAFLSEEIPEGREVFRQGDPGARFYILARGTVDVMIQTPGQEPRRAAVLRDGDFFGEIALVTDHPRNATIRTVTDCWFLTLHRTAFLTLLNEEPELRSRVMAAMARRSEASGASAPANAAAARP